MLWNMAGVLYYCTAWCYRKGGRRRRRLYHDRAYQAGRRQEQTSPNARVRFHQEQDPKCLFWLPREPPAPTTHTFSSCPRPPVPPLGERVLPLPRLVGEKGVDGGGKVVAGLLKIKDGDVVLGGLAGDHEAADLGLARLLGLALDGARREADAGAVVGAGDEERAAGREEVVRGEVVGSSLGGGEGGRLMRCWI
jgi:hypothetical protein